MEQAPRGETVWLLGMMGAGKSAVGRHLARRLGCAFVDTDAEVETAAGRGVAEIFAAEGEARFRELERRAIEAVAGEPRVVALGGGAATQAGAVEWLARTGTLVYLRARPATLLARLGDARDRPLLAGRDPRAREARLGELLERRRGCYERADVIVDTDEWDPETVAAKVAEALGTRGRGGRTTR